LSWVPVFYFFFHLLWGMNYYRIPLHEKLQIEKEYSLQQLKSFAETKLLKINELQFKITKNDTLALQIPYSDNEIYHLTLNGYEKLPSDLKEFGYKNKSIKTLLFSYPLIYMGLAVI